MHKMFVLMLGLVSGTVYASDVTGPGDYAGLNLISYTGKNVYLLTSDNHNEKNAKLLKCNPELSSCLIIRDEFVEDQLYGIAFDDSGRGYVIADKHLVIFKEDKFNGYSGYKFHYQPRGISFVGDKIFINTEKQLFYCINDASSYSDCENNIDTEFYGLPTSSSFPEESIGLLSSMTGDSGDTTIGHIIKYHKYNESNKYEWDTIANFYPYRVVVNYPGGEYFYVQKRYFGYMSTPSYGSDNIDKCSIYTYKCNKIDNHPDSTEGTWSDDHYLGGISFDRNGNGYAYNYGSKDPSLDDSYKHYQTTIDIYKAGQFYKQVYMEDLLQVTKYPPEMVAKSGILPWGKGSMNKLAPFSSNKR